MKDPTFFDLYRSLRTEFKNRVDKDDWKYNVIEVTYYFSKDYYNGQNSNLYLLMCRLSKVYTPGKSGNEWWQLTSQMMYEHLVNIYT